MKSRAAPEQPVRVTVAAVRRTEAISAVPVRGPETRHRTLGSAEAVSIVSVPVTAAPGVSLATVAVMVPVAPSAPVKSPVSACAVWVSVARVMALVKDRPSIVSAAVPVHAPDRARRGAMGVGLDGDDPPQATRARTDRNAMAFMVTLDGRTRPNVSELRT